MSAWASPAYSALPGRPPVLRRPACTLNACPKPGYGHGEACGDLRFTMHSSPAPLLILIVAPFRREKDGRGGAYSGEVSGPHSGELRGRWCAVGESRGNAPNADEGAFAFCPLCR